MKHGKRYRSAAEKVEHMKFYGVDEAIKLVLESSTVKFDESIDLVLNLGVDPKQGDQQVRGAVALPHGVGKSVRVLVFAKGPKEKEAKEAGADFVGGQDLVDKILTENWLEFDKCIATPDMMAVVSKLGKVLGPRGLMPNPKIGTVTFDVGKAIKEEKLGKVEFKVDKGSSVHCVIGKKSLGAQKIRDNFLTLFSGVLKAKPSASKGVYMKNMTMSATMGPGVKVDVSQAQGLLS